MKPSSWSTLCPVPAVMVASVPHSAATEAEVRRPSAATESEWWGAPPRSLEATVLLLAAEPGRPAADGGAPHRGAAARAVLAGPAVADDLAGVHAATLDRAPDRHPQLAVQGRGLVAVEVLGRYAGRHRGLPERLVGQQVADAGDRVLVEQTGLHRCPGAAQELTELGQADLPRVGAEGVDVRVEADPAEPPLVEEPQRAAVGEDQREPVPLWLDRVAGPRDPAADVVAALVVVAPLPADVDPAAHAQVDAQDRSVAGDLAPDRLAAPVRGPQLVADQRVAQLARGVRPAHVAVGVVDVLDLPVQGGALDDGASGLDLGQLRHGG